MELNFYRVIGKEVIVKFTPPPMLPQGFQLSTFCSYLLNYFNNVLDCVSCPNQLKILDIFKLNFRSIEILDLLTKQ